MGVFTEFDLREAFDNSQFVPHFQPLVDLRTHQLQGFELLARWNHPRLGQIQPSDFIPEAERDGWIHELTQELLRKGLQAMTDLSGKYMLSVNISPLQLRDRSLPQKIEAVANDAGFSLGRLILEITESALAEDIDSAIYILSALKEAGCRLALDDFGTGYSSLLTLQRLPFDELKVDRSFVNNMVQQRDSRKIVAAVVGLGQSLSLTTVAEGVETEEQAELLLWLGCELGQGWLYGRPVPADELPSLVRQLDGKPQPERPRSVAGRLSVSSLESLPSQRLSHMQAVYDGAPVGLAFLDCNLRYMNLNRRLAGMNGHPMEAHLGRTVREMIPELFPAVEPYIRRALQGESIDGVEVVRPGPVPGSVIHLLISYEPAHDEAGEIVGLSVAIMDMTPVKRAEEAQHEIQQHLRNMMELIPQIPWVIDPEGRALDVSHRWLELTGMTDEEWRGFGWLKALHPDDLQPTIDTMREAFVTGHSIDLQYRVRRSQDDSWLRLRARGSPRWGSDAKIMCWYGVLEVVEDASPAAVNSAPDISSATPRS
jgi:PAS domain S-box-containing protein